MAVVAIFGRGKAYFDVALGDSNRKCSCTIQELVG